MARGVQEFQVEVGVLVVGERLDIDDFLGFAQGRRSVALLDEWTGEVSQGCHGVGEEMPVISRAQHGDAVLISNLAS